MAQVKEPKFLADENISPLTVKHIRKLGFDITDLIDRNKKGITNGKLIELAVRENRVILTQDLDFGEMFYFSKNKEFGVIVIRLKNPTIEKINLVFENFFSEIDFEKVDLTKSLIILDETKYRIRK